MIFISYYAAHILEFVIFLVIELFSFDAVTMVECQRDREGKRKFQDPFPGEAINLIRIYL